MTKRRLLLPLAALLAGLASGGTTPAKAVQDEPGCADKKTVKLQAIGPVGVDYCGGVRPGAYVTTKTGGCTMNFLFQGSDGHRYIGTAGHCILEKDGEQSWAANGPEAKDDADTVFGRFTYAVMDAPRDFALIRINPGHPASPSMCNWGGPTGMYTAQEAGPIFLRHSGHGLVFGWAVPGRTAVALHTLDPDYIASWGAAIWGDSGSGVMTEDGKAAAVLVELTAGDGVIGLTRIPPQLARAEQVLGITLTLVTAPLA